MSDSEDSTVTYTTVSSPFESLSDIGSSGVDEPPMMLEDPYAYVVASFQAPPSPDYVPGPEEPEQAPPLPEFVPEPVYPEFMPPEDDVLPTEEQPLPAAISPTADSPGYIADSDPEEDEEDPEEDPIDYPTNRDDDDDDEEPSSDEADDEEEEKDDEEEEEEHPALADSILPPAHCVTARISIRAQTPLRAETPSTSHPLPLPSPIILPHTRASVAMIRAAAPSTYILASRSETPPSGTPPLLPISLPTPSPPLLLPSTDHRADKPEVCLPSRKRLCIALGPRYKVGESSSAPTARPTRDLRANYGFVGTLDDEIRQAPERYVGYGITDT
ncbi:hypothetical protein Tco_0585903 [Tanacetum coccineum]